MSKVSDQDRELIQEMHAQAEERLAAGDEPGARQFWDAILQLDPSDPVATARLEGGAPSGTVTDDVVPVSVVEPDDAGVFELDLELDLPEDTGVVEDVPSSATAPTVTHDVPRAAAPTPRAPETAQPPAPPPWRVSPDEDSTTVRDLVDAADGLAEDDSESGEFTATGLSSPDSEGGEATILVSRARQALAQGRLDEAMSLASRALAVSDGMAAAQRILDGARAQAGRRASEVDRALNEGIHELEAGRPHAAIPILERVLELMPGHVEAEDFLAKAREAVLTAGPADEPPIEQVESIPLDLPPAAESESGEPSGAFAGDPSGSFPPGPAGATGPAGREDDTFAPPPPPALDELPPPPPTLGATGETLPPPSSLSPPPEIDAPMPRAQREAPGGGRSLPSVPKLVVTVLGVGVGLALGWFGMQMLLGGVAGAGSPDPAPSQAQTATQDSPAPSAPGQPAPSASAPEGSAAAPEGATTASPGPATPPAPKITRRDVPELLRRADEALSAGRDADAIELLQAAQVADPTNFRVIDRLDAAQKAFEARREAEEKISSGLRAFDEGLYDEALRIFYRIPEDRRPAALPGWIAAGWYNLGVRALHAGNTREAVRFFTDCLDAAPDDGEAARHREVARRYRNRPIDDAYRIYVANIPMRAISRR